MLRADSGIQTVLCRRSSHLRESTSLGAPAVPVTLVRAIAGLAAAHQLTSVPAAMVMAITGAIAPKAAAAHANGSPAHA